MTEAVYLLGALIPVEVQTLDEMPKEGFPILVTRMQQEMIFASPENESKFSTDLLRFLFAGVPEELYLDKFTLGIVRIDEKEKRYAECLEKIRQNSAKTSMFAAIDATALGSYSDTPWELKPMQ